MAIATPRWEINSSRDWLWSVWNTPMSVSGDLHVSSWASVDKLGSSCSGVGGSLCASDAESCAVDEQDAQVAVAEGAAVLAALVTGLQQCDVMGLQKLVWQHIRYNPGSLPRLGTRCERCLGGRSRYQPALEWQRMDEPPR